MSDIQFEDIRILEVITSQVTEPRNDGTEGSGLYAVPIRLSASAPPEWAGLFIANWNSPPRFTSMHRPGIAVVHRDTVTLSGTTIDEIERYHADTLKLVAEVTNRQYGELMTQRAAEQARKQEIADQHRAQIKDVAKRISFDD